MAKKSTTQISIAVLGDGINAVNAPAATVNATAPGGGPVLRTLAAGVQTPLAPPSAATVGLLITTALADLQLLGSADVGGTSVKLGAGSTFLTLGPLPSPGVDLLSAGGGDVYLQWV